MASVSTGELRQHLGDVSRSVPEPTWDFLVYCRFLAGRLPEAERIEAAEFGRLAEELISELEEGVDRTTGQTFEPPLLSGRSDLLYDFFRAKLRLVAGKAGGPEFAAAVAASAAASARPPAPAPDAPHSPA